MRHRPNRKEPFHTVSLELSFISSFLLLDLTINTLVVFSVGSCLDHIAWIEKTLGGKREMVMPDRQDEKKVMHAALHVNGGPLYVSDRMGDYGAPGDKNPSTGTHLYLGYNSIEEAQNVWDAAVKAKATVRMPFEKQFWGSYYGVIQDPFGSVWAISAKPDEPSGVGHKTWKRMKRKRVIVESRHEGRPRKEPPRRAARSKLTRLVFGEFFSFSSPGPCPSLLRPESLAIQE